MFNLLHITYPEVSIQLNCIAIKINFRLLLILFNNFFGIDFQRYQRYQSKIKKEIPLN